MKKKKKKRCEAMFSSQTGRATVHQSGLIFSSLMDSKQENEQEAGLSTSPTASK